MRFEKGEIYWIEFKNRNYGDGSKKGFFRYIGKYYCRVGNDTHFDAGLILYDYQTKRKDYAHTNLFKDEAIIDVRKATEEEKEVMIEDEI